MSARGSQNGLSRRAPGYRVRRCALRSTAALASALALSLAGHASAQPAPPDSAGGATGEESDEAARDGEPTQGGGQAEAPDPRGDAFPTSGSKAGSPLHSYEERGSNPPKAAEDARGFTEEPGWESEDYVLFPARAVLFPARLLVDVVFTPIELLLAGIDRHKLVPRVVDFFYFDKAHTAGFYPSAAFESGYGLSFGAKIFDNDLAGHEETLSFAAQTGGRYVQSYEAVFEGDRVGGSRLWLENRTRYEVEPAILFFGLGGGDRTAAGGDLGPRDTNTAVRFQQERFLGLLSVGSTLGEQGDLTKLGVTGIYNHRRFQNEQRSFPEPSIEDVYDTARIAGFDSGVNTLELDLSLIRDTRDNEFASSGSYAELLAGGVVPANGYHYWHVGAELTQFIDLYRKTRVLALRVAFEGVAGHEDEIPFVELPRLGGVHDLRGYLTDRFRDKLAGVATAEYRYPIHQLISGKLFVDAGNVGQNPNQLIGSSPFAAWKVGAGGGLLLHTEEDVLLSIDLAYGDQFTFFATTAPLQFFHKRSRQL